MSRFCRLILWIGLIPASAFGQTQADTLSFEVASIRPVEFPMPAAIAAGELNTGMTMKGDRVHIGLMSLADLIRIAFKVKPYQVFGPGWMNSQKFDIHAKMPEGATSERVPEMLRTLLAERFRLKFHREKKKLPVYALVAGKDSSKLKPSPPDPEFPPEPPKGATTLGTENNQIYIQRRGHAGPLGGDRTLVTQDGTMRMSMTPDGQVRLEISKVSMEEFAEMLTKVQDRPVFDRTGIKGNYQLTLHIPTHNVMAIARAAGVGGVGVSAPPFGNPNGPLQASDPFAASMMTSVRELGLRLDSRRELLEVIVIDRIEKMPTPN